MGRKPSAHAHNDREPVASLAALACPNPDCSHFHRFDAGNLDAAGNVVKGRAEALFGRLKAIKERVAALGIGTTVNASHPERLNGTLRCQPARRPRCVSRDG